MLRWAILGTGFISNTVVAAIAGSPDSRVHVVAGRDADRVPAFQQTHGIERSTTDYLQAVADPDVDAVYIGLPNHQHHPLAIAAAQHGKAVLSEKSLTTTMADAHALADAVRGRIFFVEGLMYLAHPLLRTLTDLIADGRLGTVRSVTGRYAANIGHLVNPEGRGTIFNLGCYPVSLLHLVVQTAFGDGAFTDRQMWGAGNLTSDGTIGDATLSVRLGNGMLANLQSTDNYGMTHDFAIAGDRGVIRCQTNPWLPVAGRNVLTWTPYGEAEATEEIVVEDPHDAFHHQIALVERCVAAGLTEAPRPSPRLDDSLEIMELLTQWERHCLA